MKKWGGEVVIVDLATKIERTDSGLRLAMYFVVGGIATGSMWALGAADFLAYLLEKVRQI